MKNLIKLLSLILVTTMISCSKDSEQKPKNKFPVKLVLSETKKEVLIINNKKVMESPTEEQKRLIIETHSPLYDSSEEAFFLFESETMLKLKAKRKISEFKYKFENGHLYLKTDEKIIFIIKGKDMSELSVLNLISGSSSQNTSQGIPPELSYSPFTFEALKEIHKLNLSDFTGGKEGFLIKKQRLFRPE